MDDDVSCLIQRACELARDLESNLPSQSADSVLSCVDEIVEKLNAAKARLLVPPHREDEAAVKQEMIRHHHPQMAPATSSFLQEWLSVSRQFVSMPQLQAPTRTPAPPRGALQIMTDSGPRDVEASAEGDVEASPSRRRKSRKDDAEKTTMMVPAVQFGNTDVPPEDGFTWRKYGQKEILGSNYPRSYFRCTHQKLYQCPAKKQVQRLDNNPNMFAVTYRGSHTCHMSSTAPSSSVPPQLMITQSHDITHTNNPGSTIASSQLSPSSTSVSGWLSSVHLGLLPSGSGVVPAGTAAGGSAGPSSSRFGADYPVADMADVMFNSGSSSGNSMESLFPSAEEKWEAGDKKS
ncbi:WRKY transcription factor 55-like isoform X2 [Prosopis cineraria]|uniref:WRKY transcription factor 55-like isoform X2 n=1 Tax=Prosopis cineraria TaxID=364024 RepID=UPI002410048D|nr:WRKY transcription factor 55-like isoform X2 [Prosopis cineraria]